MSYLDNEELEATKKNREKRCEYCQDNETLKSCNFGGSASLRIVGNIINIWGDKKKFHLFKKIYEPRFIIKYCPMCGKKIK